MSNPEMTRKTNKRFIQAGLIGFTTSFLIRLFVVDLNTFVSIAPSVANAANLFAFVLGLASFMSFFVYGLAARLFSAKGNRRHKKSDQYVDYLAEVKKEKLYISMGVWVEDSDNENLKGALR